jgi:hypothetical protein
MPFFKLLAVSDEKLMWHIGFILRACYKYHGSFVWAVLGALSPMASLYQWYDLLHFASYRPCIASIASRSKLQTGQCVIKISDQYMKLPQEIAKSPFFRS